MQPRKGVCAQQERPGAVTSSESHAIPYLQPLSSRLTLLLLVCPICNASNFAQRISPLSPIANPKAPEQTTTNKKKKPQRQASHRVPTTPPADPGGLAPAAAAWRARCNQSYRAIHLGAAPATGPLPAILAILAILDRRKTDEKLTDGPCWASGWD